MLPQIYLPKLKPTYPDQNIHLAKIFKSINPNKNVLHLYFSGLFSFIYVMQLANPISKYIDLEPHRLEIVKY